MCFECLYYGGVYNESLDFLPIQIVSVSQLIQCVYDWFDEIFCFILPQIFTSYSPTRKCVCLSLAPNRMVLIFIFSKYKQLGEFLLCSGWDESQAMWHPQL